MPANYEFNLDHGVIEVAAWDIVTLGDLDSYLAEVTSVPHNLRGAIEYIDFGQVAEIRISEHGALQVAHYYEQLITRGLRGSVIYAPSDRLYEVAKTMIGTFDAIGGILPDGYRLTRHPVHIGDVPRFLLGLPDEELLVA
jgi:hypothetical protein